MSTRDQDEEDDAVRRQREMNLFAAMAAGGSFIDTSTRTPSSKKLNRSSSLEAGTMVNTGTFAMSAEKPPSGGGGESNLEAAVAALTGEENRTPSPKPSPMFRPEVFSSMRPKTKQTPMQSEKVLLPRPLFFGSVLPPRVLKEARQAVSNELKNQQKRNGDTITEAISSAPHSLHKLSPGIRNLVGAIETFGFGLSAFPDNETDETDDKYWKGTSYVATYQPVFGDEARAEREKQRIENEEPPELGGDSPLSKIAAGEKTMEFFSPTATATGQATTGDVPADESESNTPAISNKSLNGTHHQESKAPDQHLFAMWARGESSQNITENSSNTLEFSATKSSSRDDDNDNSNKPTTSEKNLFSQWALGESPSKPGGSFVSVSSGVADGRSSVVITSQSQNLCDSDDDLSVVDSELKTQVGVNEQLDKALKSLADHGESNGPAAAVSTSITAEESHALLSQLFPVTPGGRPLSNLELTEGRVPLFACDDAPLPVEADLGIYQTKEEQNRALERKRSQEIIAKHAVPNFFGSISCPNPSLHPDDLQSWNSRTAPVLRLVRSSSGGSGAPSRSPMSPPPSNVSMESPATVRGRPNVMTPDTNNPGRHPARVSSASPASIADSKASTSKKQKKTANPRLDGNARFGWWNVKDDAVTASFTSTGSTQNNNPTSPGSQLSPQSLTSAAEHPLQLPPMHHAADTLQPNTRLTPQPEDLREENLPLSRLHAATSTSMALPFLSDRPPSFRYVQIDVQEVIFKTLSAEIEPLFCSLAIYHVETLSDAGNNPKSAPLPNLQRCGRVTEILNFDYVETDDAARKCAGSLWPYAASRDEELGGAKTAENLPESERTVGTRCGVFPVPSNLNISNLYAILIVHKVFSEASDVSAAYMRQDKNAGAKNSTSADMGSLKDKAEKRSKQFGQILMPFAFGVAPLLQVVGTEVPTVPSSRAVQIPLFRLDAGLGERPIIDHVMVMLYPRADHGNASVCELTSGSAMLVMRNYGYLGLHSVIHSKSSLARRRLVDFTGELQVRRRNESDAPPEQKNAEEGTETPCFVVDPWRSQFVAEPTKFGGRNTSALGRGTGKASSNEIRSPDKKEAIETGDVSDSTSHLYAQELAVVPLMLTPPASRTVSSPARVIQQPGHSGIGAEDKEQMYYSSFCNELLCHPRLIHNCLGKNVVVKVEMREIKWSNLLNAFLAFLPEHGPSIHNPRRGPHLVQESFTCCAYKTYNPHFMDEFKVKLPLVLPERRVGGDVPVGGPSLLFSVYNIRTKPKKKRRKIFPSMASRGVLSRKRGDSDESSVTGEGDEESHARFELLGCGFLPISSESDPLCLISDGLHDVAVTYSVKPPRASKLPPGTLVLSQQVLTSDKFELGSKADSSISNTQSSADSPTTSNHQMADTDDIVHNETRSQSNKSDDTGKGDLSSLRDEASLNSAGSVSTKGRRPSSRNLTPTRGDDTASSELSKMTLQVRIVVHSSVLPQNSAVNSFLCRSPGEPRPLSQRDMSSSSSPWKLPRAELRQRVDSESLARISPAEKDLLSATINMSRPNYCPVQHRALHFLRALSQLMRTLVVGIGEPSLVCANPASLTALRLHSFSSLLHICNSVSTFISKSGMTQLDGKEGWNLSVLAKVVSMAFEEETIFSNSNHAFGEEVFDPDEDLEQASQTDAALDDKSERLRDVKTDTKSPLQDDPKSLPTMNKPPRGRGHKRHHRNQNLWIPEEVKKIKDTQIVGESSSLDGSKKSEQANAEDKEITLSIEQLKSMFEGSPPSGNQEQFKAKSTSDVGKVSLSEHSRSRPRASGEKSEVKIDSKYDFQFALKAGSSESEDGLVSHMPPAGAPRTRGTSAAIDLIDAYNDLGRNDRTGWGTMPLATIRETSMEGSNLSMTLDDSAISSGRARERKKSSLEDDEIIPKESKPAPRKMRIPRRRTTHDSSEKLASTFPGKEGVQNPKNPMLSLPTTDEEIDAASTAFFDAICKNFGYSGTEGNGTGEAEQLFGHAHHRKTRSRSSIDWTLPKTDTLIQKHPEMEVRARNRGEDVHPLMHEDAGMGSPVLDQKGSGDGRETALADLSEPQTTAMQSLEQENSRTLKLPGFLDRIGKLGQANGVGRWFPFTYEVVIFQWVALLVEQRRSGMKAGKGGGSSVGSGNGTEPPTPNESSGRDLRIAASKARGVVISCAPVLFEIIKSSLGWRIHKLVRRRTKSKHASLLVTLDGDLLMALEQVISLLADACIDSRNFESWEFRRTSMEVSESIVRFLRDMFGFLEPQSVHRLVMVYFSRFVTKEGKQWKENDSSIGLRSTWEISKLRLNAVTAFVRFPDFVRVCSPVVDQWGSWPLTSPASETRTFFSNALNQLHGLALRGYAAINIPAAGSYVEIPPMRPHWLAELIVDICLSGTGHVEHAIQYRAASLLHELFWTHSQEGKATGASSALATMYVPFLERLLGHITYMSSFSAKHQLRKDVMPCALFVLEFAPVGLLRALWRKLCIGAEGKGTDEKYGGIGGAHVSSTSDNTSNSNEDVHRTSDSISSDHEHDIFDMFSLLNLALASFEYEGCDSHVEEENEADANDQRAIWQREFLPAQELDSQEAMSKTGKVLSSRYMPGRAELDSPRYSTSSSRKWHAHDGSLVIINTSIQIVREMITMLRPPDDASPVVKGLGPLSVPDDRNLATVGSSDSQPSQLARAEVLDLRFSLSDTVIFVRAVTTLYLHALALNQSDVVVIKALSAAVEVVKIFGIKIFLEAVGETLQHWMRVVSVQCGARRAEVRIAASEFLALILRLTWDSYGSFFRVRLPLLAVQTEVMERIVATAASRFYREQRRQGTVIHSLSNDSAEASLSPLWRTLDRLHQRPASQNVAFVGALVRLAEKMKKLYHAYIAAHALGIITRARSPHSSNKAGIAAPTNLSNEASAMARKSRISVHRVISASAGFSKQFFGLDGPSPQRDTVAHNEAVEDAFLAAADVFSPTELPSHRVAWLRRLADFHATRAKFAEEASCRFHIHVTFRKAARLHDSLWSSMPFLPWTNDENHLGDGPTGDFGDYYDPDDDMEDLSIEDISMLDMESRKNHEISHSFRRIFYRVASSVRMRTGDWEIGGNKNLFYGVTFPSEYRTISPWMSLKEVEEGMVDEAEFAGELFLRAGIVESSRYTWNLATQFYAETFNYAKLAYVYKRLATVVASQIPVVDSGNQLELSSPLGRFYRVWFHGGAPDELIGAEFVYRTDGSVKLEQFGRDLCEVLTSILPEGTPIDLLLDDGRPEESKDRKKSTKRPLAATYEPVRIKVTPLRPLLKRADTIRGTPEWFYRYTDVSFENRSAPPSTHNYGSGGSFRRTASSYFNQNGAAPKHHEHSRSFNASVFASGSVSAGGRSFHAARSSDAATPRIRDESYEKSLSMGGGEMIGVDSFSFMQPVDKDRHRATRDWLRAQAGATADKSLRVTQLNVEDSFPACVARQKVIHRTVFIQSPLEAGVDAVCSWCAVLFRTGVATNGLAVLGGQMDQGIGTAAAKVVADCIHSSRVGEIGIFMLKSEYDAEDQASADGTSTRNHTYNRLSEEEWTRLQKKLARAVVIFLELLHLLIARNRSLLLAVVEARKRRDGGSSVVASLSRSIGGPTTKEAGPTVASSPDSAGHRFGRPASLRSGRSSSFNDAMAISYDGGYNTKVDDGGHYSMPGSISGADKTDSAIAIQSELQRAYISMMRKLYPNIARVLRSETPRWLKHCCQESYFSTAGFRQAKLPMGEELFFFGGGGPSHSDSPQKTVYYERDRDVPAIVGSFSPTNENEAVAQNTSQHNESMCASSIISEPTKNPIPKLPNKGQLPRYQST